MALRDRVVHWLGLDENLRGFDFSQLFSFNGINYPYGYGTGTLSSKQEAPAPSFDGYVQAIYKANPVVFACITARMRLFSEARFIYRAKREGRPTDRLFGNASLKVLETPWPNGTTRGLLARAMQDADIAGNFYAYRSGETIRRMRPDWVSIVLGSNREPDDPAKAIDAEVVGYVYAPPGYHDGVVVLLPEEVCHFAPIPDPSARFRGMSWVATLISDVMADQAATEHKQKFFENGATVNLVVNFDSPIIKTQEQFDETVAAFRRGHEGTVNAFKTLFLAHGSTANAIGADMLESAFKEVQGAGETRICMAAGVPPIMIGASEGLAAATYSNYGQARRAFADLTMRPLWGEAAGAFSSVVDVPDDAELWYDDQHISFLQEDEKDDSEILNLKSQATRTLVDGGFTPDSVVKAVEAGDLSLLEHTNLYSVQLQPPTPDQPATAANGAGALPIGAGDV